MHLRFACRTAFLASVLTCPAAALAAAPDVSADIKSLSSTDETKANRLLKRFRSWLRVPTPRKSSPHWSNLSIARTRKLDTKLYGCWRISAKMLKRHAATHRALEER